MDLLFKMLVVGGALGIFWGMLGWTWYKVIQGDQLFSKIGDYLLEEFGEKWYYNAIAGCPNCISGQVALWIGGLTTYILFPSWMNVSFQEFFLHGYWTYGMILHFIQIVVAIYIGGRNGN